MDAKLYSINAYGSEFVTGNTRDGRQVILGPHSYSELVGFFFNKDGTLLSVEHRLLPPELQVVATNPYDPVEVRKLEAGIQLWREELGLEPMTVQVRKFSKEGVRIEDLPWHFEEFLQNPVAFEPDERLRARLQDDIDEWRREGMFVFWWGKDYWMDAEGNVDST